MIAGIFKRPYNSSVQNFFSTMLLMCWFYVCHRYHVTYLNDLFMTKLYLLSNQMDS